MDDEQTLLHISANINAKLAELHISQHELARRAEMVPQTVSLICRGKQMPSAANLNKIALALEIPIADLFAAQYNSAMSYAEDVDDSQVLETIAYNLRKHMARARINQVELAKRSGVAQTQISTYLRAERMPSIPNLMRLARGLTVTYPELLRETRQPANSEK